MNNKRQIANTIISLIIGGSLVISIQWFNKNYYFDLQIIKHKVVSPIPSKQSPIEPEPTKKPTPTPTKQPVKKTPKAEIIRGIASHYNTAGCLGCDANAIMANGEKLIDSALTLALTPETVAKYKLLNKQVLVKNPKTGLSTMAKVTDTGGFGKLNRIADLTDGTRDAIGCGGLCEVEITIPIS